MERAYLAAAGGLDERLVAALEAGQAAGGDSRGQQSAAVVVERPGAAAETREGIDRVCDLRVDDHPEPIAELRRLLGIHLRWDALRRAGGHYAPGATRRESQSCPRRTTAFRTTRRSSTTSPASSASTGGPTLHWRMSARALELDPALRAAVRGDADFAMLAGDGAFRAAVAEPLHLPDASPQPVRVIRDPDHALRAPG